MLKVALAQIDTVLGDKQKNLLHIEEFCLKAALKQADVICFPELATTGYSPDLLGTELWPLSESRGDKTDRLLSQLATELDLTIICGFVERGIAKKLNYVMSYSIDFRRRILSIKKHEGLSIRETAKQFHIGTTTTVPEFLSIPV